MKKIISILALVLAITALLSVAAFAEDAAPAKTFALGEGADAVIEAKGLTVTPAADSIAVVAPATPGADYSILLVSGSALPTSESTIAYINQANAATNAVNFSVLPKLTSCTENMTLYIGSNATGETLIAVPLVYDEEEAQYALGDVNGDTVIDSSDSLSVLLYFANGTEFETSEGVTVPVEVGNVNGDTAVDSSDSLAILLYFANGTEF